MKAYVGKLVGLCCKRWCNASQASPRKRTVLRVEALEQRQALSAISVAPTIAPVLPIEPPSLVRAHERAFELAYIRNVIDSNGLLSETAVVHAHAAGLFGIGFEVV